MKLVKDTKCAVSFKIFMIAAFTVKMLHKPLAEFVTAARPAHDYLQQKSAILVIG